MIRRRPAGATFGRHNSRTSHAMLRNATSSGANLVAKIRPAFKTNLTACSRGVAAAQSWYSLSSVVTRTKWTPQVNFSIIHPTVSRDGPSFHPFARLGYKEAAAKAIFLVL